MKIMYKMLLLTAVTAMPLAAANAASSAAEHRAWIAAQKIDIQPTITVREVPADQVDAVRAAPPAVTPSGVQPATPATPAVPGVQPAERAVPAVQPDDARRTPPSHRAAPATRSVQPAQPASPSTRTMPSASQPGNSGWSGNVLDPTRSPSSQGEAKGRRR